MVLIMEDIAQSGVYLDYQSSKPVDPRVIEAVNPYLYENFGNPSSLHFEGDRASEVLERSREKIARFIKADTKEIILSLIHI